MAKYLVSAIAQTTIHANGRFQDFELRGRSNKIYQELANNSKDMFPNYDTLRRSSKIPMKIDYFLNTSGALDAGGRTHNHTGGTGDTAIMNLSWSPLGRNFSITLKQADDKTRTWQNLFNNEVYQVILSFIKGSEKLVTDYLFSNRTGVMTGDVNGSFNTGTKVYEIEAKYTDRAINTAGVVLDYNALSTFGHFIVCNGRAFEHFKFLAKQGAQNSTNYSFQYDGLTYLLDTTLTQAAIALDGSYTDVVFYVIPYNTVGVLDWNPQQNKGNVKTTVNQYGVFVNPIDNMRIGVHQYEARADGTPTNGGDVQDVVTQYQFTSDISIAHAPSSETDRTPIMLFAVKII